MLKSVKMIAAAAALALGMGALLAPAAEANTATGGALTIAVPNTQVYKAYSCTDYPFTVKVNVPAGTDWSTTVNITSPDAWGDSEYLHGTGPATKTGYAHLCPLLDGVGSFSYEGTLEYTLTRTVREWVEDGYWDSQYDESTDTWTEVWVDTSYWDTSTEYDDVSTSATAVSTLKMPSAATVNASPEPIRKGATQYVKGKVTYKDGWWDTRPVKYKYVSVQYRRTGSAAWTTLGSAKTNSYGNYTFKTTAKYDGKYRVVFAGTGTLGSVTSGTDYVDVT